jgi:hypothetical protein
MESKSIAASQRKEKTLMYKLTVGALVKKHGGSNRPATHFFHPWMKKIYKADMKPHLEKALNDHAARFRP